MQVEVNEENIVKYNLVQLTGNSAETLLTAAAEAKKNGYELTCRIPDDDLHINVFEAAGATSVSEEQLKHWQEQENIIVEGQRQRHEIRDEFGRLIGVQFDPNQNVVKGEIVESHIED